MSRYNIKHKEKYYIFSSICDGIVEEFNTFEELQDYRLKQYGVASFDNEKSFEKLNANKMEFKEIIISQILGGNEKTDTIIECFGLLDKDDMLEVFKELIEMYKDLEETE